MANFRSDPQEEAAERERESQAMQLSMRSAIVQLTREIPKTRILIGVRSVVHLRSFDPGDFRVRIRKRFGLQTNHHFSRCFDSQEGRLGTSREEISTRESLFSHSPSSVGA